MRCPSFRRDGRHSLATLARVPREGSWANPLPCRLLSVQLQCRGVRLATLSLGPGTRSVPNAVALSNCRTPIASGSSRGWIPRLWVSRRRTDPTTLTTFAVRGSKATDDVCEAAMRRSQDPGAEVRCDLSLFLSLTSESIKSQLRPSVRHAGHRRLFPRVVSATVDIADTRPTWRSPSDAASEVLFLSSLPTTAWIHLPCHFFGCDVVVIVVMMRCVSSASTGPAWLDVLLSFLMCATKKIAKIRCRRINMKNLYRWYSWRIHTNFLC